MRMFPGPLALLFYLLLTGCSSYQVAPVGSGAGDVDVLFSPPQRPYTTIGIVSAKRYKPGWTDPTVSDALPQLRAAGRELGADAVIVLDSRSETTGISLSKRKQSDTTDAHA